MSQKRVSAIDKSGEIYEIARGCASDFPFVSEMYRVFQPRPASQGLPPENPEACRLWIDNLFRIAQNFVAWRKEAVIGHAAFIPDVNGKSGEFVIFVDQHHRNIGIGTELTRFSLRECRLLGCDTVWLTVNLMNVTAVNLYRKIGFKDCDRDIRERMMAIQLTLPYSRPGR